MHSSVPFAKPRRGVPSIAQHAQRGVPAPQGLTLIAGALRSRGVLFIKLEIDKVSPSGTVARSFSYKAIESGPLRGRAREKREGIAVLEDMLEDSIQPNTLY